MRQGTTTTLVTPNTASQVTFDGINADGSKVYFHTIEDLGAEGDGAVSDIYQAQGGTFTLLTPGTPTAAQTFKGSSTDGTRVFFETSEQVAGTTDGDATGVDVYVSVNGTVSLISTGGAASIGAFFEGSSANGQIVFFRTNEALDGADTDAVSDVYSGTGGLPVLITGNGGQSSSFSANSADGSRVFFVTDDDLAGDVDGIADVFIAEGGLITLISPATPTQPSSFGGISADGSIAYFTTFEALSGDGDVTSDVYRRTGGVTTLMTAGDATIYNSNLRNVSADGSQIVFETQEPVAGTGDTDTATDLFRSNGTTKTLLSGAGANLPANWIGTSRDGQRVFFITSEALDGSSDTDSANDIYVAEGLGVTLVSTGGATVPTFRGSSADGSRAVFTTTEAIPGTGDADTAQDVYVSRTTSGGSDPDPTDPDPTDPDPTTPDPITPDPITPNPTKPDTTPPDASLRGETTQKGKGSLTVIVTCDDTAPCEARASGKLQAPKTGGKGKNRATKSYPLSRASASIPAGGEATLKLKIPKQAAKAAKKALKAKKKVTAKIKVIVTDAAGNERSLNQKLKLK